MKLFKKIAPKLGALIALLILLIGGLIAFGSRRLTIAPVVTASPVQVPSGPEAIKRGEILADISGCTGCHTPNLTGEVFVDEAPIGYIPAPNLTGGAGGVGGDYSDEDWELAIRHGIAQDGRVITTMPTEHYAAYGDDDLADLIAFLRQAEPQDSEWGLRQMMLPGNVIFGIFEYSNWAVSTIDHEAVGGEDAPIAANSAEYGEYLVNITSCGSCHAEDLAGNYGQLDAPPGPNLTTLAAQWSAEEFATALQTGVTPDGRGLAPVMPWQKYAKLTPTQVDALWTYISSQPELENNTP